MLGIQIKKDQINIAWTSCPRNSPLLKKALSLPCSDEDDNRQISSKIKKAIRKSSIKEKQVNVLISSEHVQIIQFNISDVKNLNTECKSQFTRMHPDRDFDTYYWDHKLIKNSKSKQPTVLLFVIKKEDLENYISIIKNAGLTPSHFELSGISLSYLIGQHEKLNSYCTMYVEDVHTHITFFKGEELSYYRIIQTDFGKSLKENTLDLTNANSNYDDFITECVRSLDYVKSNNFSHDIDQIHISSDNQLSQNLIDSMTERLSTRVALVDTAKSIVIPKDSDDPILQRINELSVPIGLSFGKSCFNFLRLKPKKKVQKIGKRKLNIMKPIGISFVLFTLISSVLYSNYIKTLINKKNIIISDIQNNITLLNTNSSDSDSKKKELIRMNKIFGNPIEFYRAMHILSNTIPSNVIISRLSYAQKNRSIMITGHTTYINSDSVFSFVNFINKLEENPGIKSVRLMYYKKLKSKENQGYEFKLSSNIINTACADTQLHCRYNVITEMIKKPNRNSNSKSAKRSRSL